MSLMTAEKLQSIVEAALMVGGHPLTIAALQNLFNEDERPSNADIKTALAGIHERHKDSGIELHEVASGYRLQAKTELSPWLAKLWEERAPRYSRAFLETLAIIAYKQPITRAEIEEIRGVTVSSNIMKTLSEREWIRLVGFRDTPGKPALYGTTKTFLDHFSLASLSALPTLAEFKDLQTQDLQVQLAIENSELGPDNSEVIPEEREAVVADANADDTTEQQTEATDEAREVTAEETPADFETSSDDETSAEESEDESDDEEFEDDEITSEDEAEETELEAAHESQEAAATSETIDAHEELNQANASEVEEDVDETDLALAQS